jgi:hypothetical protein
MTATQERPYQLEVIRVPMADGSLGYTVQAVMKRALGDCGHVGDVWHHKHTFPGTPEGHLDAVQFGVRVQIKCGQAWHPEPPTWLLASCRKGEYRLPSAEEWKAWRAGTGRK